MEPTPTRIGPFEIVRELGRGAMGVVYHARRSDLDREVALKVIAAGTADSAAAAARFRREAQAAAQLAGHPGIVGVYDIGEDDGLAWFSMELVTGLPFDEVIRDGDLDPRGAATIVAQAARAVEHAHRQGIIHRDLKPANILVTPDGTARVTDFGLVSVQDVHGDLTRITTTDVLVGTPAYMSPEQVEGRELDGRADTYSLGVTLYEALAGQPPFPGESIYTVLHQVLSQAPPPLRSLAPTVPAELDAIVQRAMAKDRADRYESAAALSADLENWLAGRPITARASGTVQRLGKRVKRNRRAVAIGAVAALLLAAGGLLWWGLRRAQQQQAGTLTTVKQQGAKRDRNLAAAEAYRELSRLTVTDMRWLESHWNGLTRRPEDVRARVDAVLRVAADVRGRMGDLPVIGAWEAVARGYGTQAWEFPALEQLVQQYPDDPFPRMILARVTLMLWAWAYQPPGVVVGQLDVRLVFPPEPEVQRRRRQRAEELLTACLKDRDRVGGDVLRNEFELLAGALHLVKHEAVQALQRLTPLADNPDMSGIVDRLRGHALFDLQKPSKAAEVWERLANRQGWHDMLIMANFGWQLAASLRDEKPEFQRKVYEHVLYNCGVLLQAQLQPARVTGQQVTALLGLAALDARLGVDPNPRLDEALAAVDREMQLAGDRTWDPTERLIEVLSFAAEQDPRFGRNPVPRLRRIISVASTLLAKAETDGGRAAALGWRGRARLDLAVHRLPTGEPLDDLIRESGDDLTQAAALVPIHAGFRQRLAKWHRLQADLARTQGAPAVPHLERALAAIRRAVSLDPASNGQRYDLIETLRLMAEFSPGRRRKSSLWLAEALQECDELLRRSPQVEVLLQRGDLLVTRAELAFRNGQDPSADCTEALQAFQRARDASGSILVGKLDRRWANALYLRAQWEQGHGVDPVPSLRGAVAHYGASLKIRDDIDARADRALALLAMGDWAAATGGDPLPQYRNALADLDAVAARYRNNAIVHHNRGTVRRAIGKALIQRGGEPTEMFRAAEADLKRALELDPGSAGAHNDRGLLHRLWGEWTDQMGGVPDAYYQQARIAFGRALEIEPDMPAALNNRGNLLSDMARLADRRREDPRPLMAAAVADFDRLIVKSPDDVGAYNNRGLLHHRRGALARGSGENPDPFLQLALADFEAALRLAPNNAAAFANRGLVHMELAEVATDRGHDPLPHMRRAVQDHSSALQLLPGDPGTLINRAVARRAIGAELRRQAEAAAKAAGAEGVDDAVWHPVMEEALTDVRGAIARNGRLWQAHAMEGRILADLGRRAEARAAYEAALALNAQVDVVREWLAELEEGK